MSSTPVGDRPPSAVDRLGGHAWTILSAARGIRFGEPNWNWSAVVPDVRLGSVRLSGVSSGGVRSLPGAGASVVIVHGLAGSAESGYVRRMARQVVDHGWDAVAINLRGADGLGEDIYHAGLGCDLARVLGEIPGGGPIFVVGYSLGGHLALRYIAEVCPAAGAGDGPGVEVDPRVRAAVAICAPLDLAASVRVIDGPEAWLYRRYLLRRLNRLYEPVARRRGEFARAAEARRVVRIQEWDEVVVAPRFGFAGAEDYYRSVSVAPDLGRLAVPSLLIAARHDPMVPAGTLLPHLDEGERLETVWSERGGHVAIPGRGLGMGAGTLEAQVVQWLARHAAA